MLKALFFAAAVLFPAAASAQAAPLVVGAVRDRDGSAVAGASVTVFGTEGSVLGRGTTDRLGTFAVAPSATPASVAIACRHCEPVRRRADGSAPLTVVVRRWRALETRLPDGRDLAALPYTRIADAMALAPYVVASSNGAYVSDRGLARGNALVLDDGAPVYGGAGSATLDFPARYAQRVDEIAPSRAFEYGSGAGGGTFLLDQVDPDRTQLAGDAGPANDAAVEPVAGGLYPSAGASGDGSTEQRRADFDADVPFMGGRLRAGAGGTNDDLGDGVDRTLDGARLSYATASRRYLTFANLAGDDERLGGASAAPGDERDGQLLASVRVEHPGPVTLATGAVLARDDSWYRLSTAPALGASTARAGETMYVEATTAAAAGSLFAGLGLSHDAAEYDLPGTTRDGDRLTLLPSLQGSIALGGGLAATAALSTSVRVPTALETYAKAPPPGRLNLERGALQEGGLAFDPGGRLRVEADLFREDLTGISPQRLTGIGASLVWQVAPDIALRAWTLHDSTLAFATIPYALQNDAPFSRQVLWTTYEAGPDGLRVDAIVHRDVGAARAVALDADALVPMRPRVALALGTARASGTRRYSLGLRVR